jgi:hypothetical protein
VSEDCDTGLRYDESAGDGLANTCVPRERDRNVCLAEPADANESVRYCFDEANDTEQGPEDVGDGPISFSEAVERDRGFIQTLPGWSGVGTADMATVGAQCQFNNEVTIELVVAYGGLTPCAEDGCFPARILQLHQDDLSEDFMLGVSTFDVATERGSHLLIRAAEIPDYSILTDFDLQAASVNYPAHVVVTVDDTTAALWVNGESIDIPPPPNETGDFKSPQSWQVTKLALANDRSFPRPFYGDYHFLGVYCRALAGGEIAERAQVVAAEYGL